MALNLPDRQPIKQNKNQNYGGLILPSTKATPKSSGGNNLFSNIFSGVKNAEKAGPIAATEWGLKFATDSATAFGKSLRDAVSGKDIAISLGGRKNPIDKFVGSKAKSFFENIGSKTPILPYSKEEKQQAEQQMSSGNFWDKVGAAVNVISAPFVMKDIIEAPIKVGAMALGKEFEGFGISKAAKGLSEEIITGGKQIFARFGKVDPASLQAHFDAAKKVFPGITHDDLLSQQGRHVIDWVTKQAGKITEKGGGDIPVTNSALLQAWSEIPRIWGANSIPEISKTLNNYATNLDKSRRIVDHVFGQLGLDPSISHDIVLYSKEYAARNKVLATLNGKQSSLLRDYLENIKLDYPEEDHSLINKAIETVKSVEKDIGHRLGFGHDSFVFPTSIDKIPQTIDGLENDLKPIINGNLQKFKDFTETLKAIVSPQIYTDDAKQGLRDARFRNQLVERELNPIEIFNRIGELSHQGVKVNLSTDSKDRLIKAFGENGQAIWEAIQESKKMPFSVTGSTTSGIAGRLPGGNNLVRAVYGLRWKVSPIFQLVKIPTKLYEVGLAAGIKPWDKETTISVTNYIKNNARPMVDRIINDNMLELQYQAKSIYGNEATKLMGASDNVITKAVANIFDHIANADEKIYMKSAYKKMKDLGYDLSKIPIDQQLDYMKNMPVNIIGQVDNYAKTLTKYGQGTSPLQNTMNTIFFPALFHMKIAKFALAGALTHPAATKAIASMIEVQNRWALSPEGQKWHQTTGIGQTILHEIGAAEPINIPALTGRQETAKQTISSLTTPYNPFQPVLQATRDFTGINVPFTSPPRTTEDIKARGDVGETIKNMITNMTGLSSEARVGSQIADWLRGKKGFVKSTKSISETQSRLSKGEMPTTKSLKSSMQLFVRQQNPSQEQKKAYAEERANYDFPDDKNKQKQEEDLIMRIFNSIHVKQTN